MLMNMFKDIIYYHEFNLKKVLSEYFCIDDASCSLYSSAVEPTGLWTFITRLGFVSS